MKIFVKTLRGTHFEIEVQPQDTVVNVKRNIEIVQGRDIYPAAQQMLIHQGKVLKDNTTLAQNNVAENSHDVVIMLAKNRTSPGEGSTTSPAPTTRLGRLRMDFPFHRPAPAPFPPTEPDVYGQAAYNPVAGNNLEGTIQQILVMGRGTWDRDTVLHALRVTFNNPERAVEYLYSLAAQPPPPTWPTLVPSIGPNANPQDIFPQGLPYMGSGAAGVGSLEFLRGSQQFQTMRAMMQANPQTLQPMLRELGRQNPQLFRLIQENQADFLRLINEPVEGVEGNIGSQLAAAVRQSVTVTPAEREREAIDRLAAMGFDRALVFEVFFACNKNEELAANYLLDHRHEFED